MNDWLQRRAIRASSVGHARTYVACRGTRVIAYYALSAGAVAHSEATGKMKRNAPDPIPVVLLGRLAVNRSEQGKGLGQVLLADAIRRAESGASIIGAHSLVIHALNEGVVKFYIDLGFQPMLSGLGLYLPLRRG